MFADSSRRALRIGRRVDPAIAEGLHADIELGIAERKPDMLIVGGRDHRLGCSGLTERAVLGCSEWAERAVLACPVRLLHLNGGKHLSVFVLPCGELRLSQRHGFFCSRSGHLRAGGHAQHDQHNHRTHGYLLTSKVMETIGTWPASSSRALLRLAA